MPFYIDPVAGDDAKSGKARTRAWRTLARASRQAFKPGDRVLLRRGGVWNEPIRLRGSADADHPILLGTYGDGPRPRINGGQTHAISADEPISGWRISGLELTSTNDLNPTRRITGGTCGIFLQQEDPCDALTIEDCLIHDTSGPGIYLVAAGDPKPVFQDTVIERCEVFNASCGILFLAPSHHAVDSFTRFRIAHCVVHDIGGDGIVPFCSRDGVIEHCTAYRTGLGVAPEDHSPVAIWYAWARNCVIQFCEAYDNHTGGQNADGGGFDFDGGCTDCIMQHNYSHDNDGAGYLICSWDPVQWPCTGCICRYNVSVNDGLANDYSSILFWQSVDCQAYNNTCITRVSPPLKFTSDTHGHVIANNIFYVNAFSDVPLLRSAFDVSRNQFRNNLYYHLSGAARFQIQEQRLDGLDDFVALVRGEGEITGDPRFVDMARGDFHLSAGSPCKGAGLRFPDMGTRDYYGAPLSGQGPVDIGCAAEEES